MLKSAFNLFKDFECTSALLCKRKSLLLHVLLYVVVMGKTAHGKAKLFPDDRQRTIGQSAWDVPTLHRSV